MNNIKYEIIKENDINILKPLVNELMSFQKSKAHITPERFDSMSFETRLLPSVNGAEENLFIIVKDEEDVIAYVYSNICKKEVYDSGTFGSFFVMESVKGEYVGCLSQFYINENYRGKGIGSKLFNKSMNWMNEFDYIDDIFIYVSNGNNDALNFYKNKGFNVSHDILDGFITVLRNKLV